MVGPFNRRIAGKYVCAASSVCKKTGVNGSARRNICHHLIPGQSEEGAIINAYTVPKMHLSCKLRENLN